MSVKKIQFDGNTLIDLTSDTVTAAKLHSGYTAHDANGDIITGSYTPPSGSVSVTQNGTVDVTNYASAVVAVPVGSLNSRCFIKTLSSDGPAGDQIVINSDGDSTIAAHRNDSTFVVAVMRTTAYLGSNNTFMAANLNHEYITDKGYTGVYGRYGSSGSVSGNTVSKPVTSNADATPGLITVDSDGVIRLFSSSTYVVRAGTYVVLVGW